MRVLLVHNIYRERGGEDQAVALLTERLAARGHMVETFFEDSADWARRGPLGKAAAAVTVAYSPSVRARLGAKLTSFRPDVLHAHNIFPFVTPAAYAAAADAKVPVVQTLHNFRWFCMNGLLLRDGAPCEQCLTAGNPAPGIVHGCYQGSRLRSLAMGGALAYHRIAGTWRDKVAAYVALSEFSRDKYVAAGFPSEKIRVIRNGVAASAAAAPDAASFLYLGRLSHEKGVDTLIDADTRYRAAGGRVPLVIAGDGPLIDAAHAHAARHPGAVRVTGRVDETGKAALFAKASHLLFPTACYENCPFVILESFAAGVPVIASRIGGVPELVSGDAGVLVPSGDAAALADAMRAAEAGMGGWAAQSAAARRAASERFSADRWIAETEEVYRSVMGNG